MTLEEQDQAWGRWRNATSFEELCALAVEFLDGDLPAFPGWMAPDIDEETDDLVPALAAANESGFLTTASQPGACPALSHDGLPWSQRAFVVGFAPLPLVTELRSKVQGTRLQLLDFASHETGGQALPAARHGDREYLHVGTGEGPAELEVFAHRIGPKALKSLQEARYMCLIDPEWGRDDLLWPILANDRGSSEYN